MHDIVDYMPVLWDSKLTVTPIKICEEMVDVIPEEIFKPSSKFLDICCKSGRFLAAIKERLMLSWDMQSGIVIDDYGKSYNLEIETERESYINVNQLFGLAPTDMMMNVSKRNLYKQISENNNIRTFKGCNNLDSYISVIKDIDKFGEKRKETFGDMKFDVVVGNPPYNKGMDLDFVNLGYKLSNNYVCMITPAKWQTASDEQRTASSITYGKFREEYVPHMSHVCFYPDCLDVFGISQADGISYFLIDKNSSFENNCTVVNKCNLQKNIESTCVRDITKQQSLWNIGNEIVEYLGDYEKYFVMDLSAKKEYTININTQLMQSLTASGAWDWKESCIKPSYIGNGGFLFNQNGQLLVVNKTRCLVGDEKSTVSASKDMFTSDDIEECKSFYSWINSKFVRFFILINISSLTILNNNTFRFVPAPPSGKFDHIYTDEELYKAFNLPQKYIDIIEAVIKERK